jgi:hypothetical protein
LAKPLYPPLNFFQPPILFSISYYPSYLSFSLEGDGVITLDELKAGLAARGGCPPDRQLLEAIRGADLDGNGTIEWKEWVAATVHSSLLDREEVLLATFATLDKVSMLLVVVSICLVSSLCMVVYVHNIAIVCSCHPCIWIISKNTRIRCVS